MRFDELHRRGLTVVTFGTQLHAVHFWGIGYDVAPAMRFREVDGRELVEAIARSKGKMVAWVRGGTYGIIYRRAADAEVESLTKNLASPDAALRREAAWIAGTLWDIRIVPPLVKAAHDADVATAREARDSLRRLNWDVALALDEDVIDLIAEDCASREPTVRAAAVCALRHAKGEKALALLQKALEDDSPQVRREADASSRFNARGPTAREGEPDWTQAEQQLTAGDAKAIQNTLSNLHRLGGEKTLAFAEKAYGDANPGVRSTALRLLAEIAGDRALTTIEKGLADSDKEVRRAALDGLGRFDNDRAIELLEKSLADKDSETRLCAAYALSKMACERALPALLRAAANRDGSVARHVCEGLAWIGNEKVLSWVEDQIANPHIATPQTRNVAVNCAGAIGGPRALRIVLRAYEEARLRGRAISMLGLIRGPKALAALERALSDEDSVYREFAAEALGEFGGDEALALFEKALRDPQFNVRRAAVRGLEKIGGEKAAAILLSAMTTEHDKRVRNAVIQSDRTDDPSFVKVREALKRLPALPGPEYALPPAEKVLADALERAAKGSKCVFMEMGFPSCGPCRIFDRYHADKEVAEILEKHFVVLKIDTENMPGGFGFFQKYGSGSAPSYAVLDANRKVLAKGAGFPEGGDDEESQKYRAALKAGGPNMEEKEIAALMKKAEHYAK